MNEYRADFHVHTVLSPCGDLEMSPVNIIRQAKSKKLDIIGISDHNTTRHCRLINEIGKEEGILVLPGAEINTIEEVHCLTFFETFTQLNAFQEFLDEVLPSLKNDPEIFGYQVQVDRNEKIIYQEERSLFSGLRCTIEEMEKKVHEAGGIFIPSHIDRPSNSLLAQLGFLPPDLQADALEISGNTDVESFKKANPELKKYPLIKSSDAHFIMDIGRRTMIMTLKEPSFSEIKMAFKGEGGREARIG